MSRVKKAVLFIIVVALAVFISAPIEASVDFDGKKVRIAAIKKIEPLGDNQLLFTMIDDVVISNVIPSLYIRLIKDEINIKTPLKNNKTPIKNMTIL